MNKEVIYIFLLGFATGVNVVLGLVWLWKWKDDRREKG
jgi:hypothetical protein